jgi:predicted kinase
MTKQLFATMGIPGSGKSYATQWFFNNVDGVQIINPDMIRLGLTGDESDQSRNNEVFTIAHNRLRSALSDAETKIVVFDATNIKKFARQHLLAIASEYKAKTALMIFDIDFPICSVRNEERERTVPMRAMLRMQAEFEDAMVEVPLELWDAVHLIVGDDETSIKLNPLNQS